MTAPTPPPAQCRGRDGRCPNRPRPGGLCRTCRELLGKAKVGAVRIPPKPRRAA